jgi:glycosyltransferase involved in cell wall biosynthesis
MQVLVSLRLTSDANMVTDVASLRGAVGDGSLHVFTDRPYRTEIKGVNYHYLPKIVAQLPGLRIVFRFFWILFLSAKYHVDVIVGYHMYSSGIPSRLAGWILRRPVVVYVLGKDLDQDYRRPVVGAVLKFFLRRADSITVQGQSSLKLLDSLGVPVDVVSPVIDLKKIPVMSLSVRSWDFIFVGRFSEEKRCDRFIEIVKAVAHVRPKVCAVIVGTGPLEAQVKAKVSEYGLERNITLTGWTTEVYRYLSEAKVYVLCSDNDQMPLTLIEAMACGCVPVVGHVGNVGDLVSSETGAVVQKDDIAAYVKACISLLADPDARHQKQGAGLKSIQAYSVESGSERWKSIFSRLLNKDGMRL